MPLRIVLIEDCEDDAELTAIALGDAGVDARFECVSSEAGLRDALSRAQPQLVLSDLELPGYSAEQALRCVRALAPGTPFVVLTGLVRADHPVFAAAEPPEAVLGKDALAALPALVGRLTGADDPPDMH